MIRDRFAPSPIGDGPWLSNMRMRSLSKEASDARTYFADDFPMEPAGLENLNAPGARHPLHELADGIERNPQFTEAGVEPKLRKLAEEPA